MKASPPGRLTSAIAPAVQPSVTMRDLYRILFRHKRKALGFFAGVVGLAIAVTFLTPKTYRSEGGLFVRLGRENATLDPTAMLGQDAAVAIPFSRETEINSVVEILRSRVLAEKVVDALGPGAVLGPAAGAKSSARDEATRRLVKGLTVEPVKKSEIICVSYEGGSPADAQAVVAKLTDFFLEQHTRLNRTAGAHEFLAEQTEKLRAELAAKEEQLRVVKDRTGFADLQAQRKILIERIGRLEDDLLTATAAAKASQARIDSLGEKLLALPKERVAAQTAGIGNEGTDRMREQHYALRLRELEMASMYTEAHPKMQAIHLQTQAAKEALGKEEPTRTQVTTGPNRAYEETHLAMLQEQPLQASLEAKTAALTGQLAGARGQLASLNENEVQMADLQREIEMREACYRKYSATLEQARVDRALSSEKLSNISIVQPATYDARPVRPRALRNLSLGLLAGLFGGAGLALLAEYLDHSFKTPEDIEKRLELPALVSIPRLERRQIVLNGRN